MAVSYPRPSSNWQLCFPGHASGRTGYLHGQPFFSLRQIRLPGMPEKAIVSAEQGRAGGHAEQDHVPGLRGSVQLGEKTGVVFDVLQNIKEAG